MNRLQLRLGKVEGKLLPKSGEAVLMRVPGGEEQRPRIKELQDLYTSRDYTLLTDDGRCLPNRPLWEPLGIDDLDDTELNDIIAALEARIAATAPETFYE